MKFTEKGVELYTQHCKSKAVKINGVDHISIHDAINALSIASDGDLADVRLSLPDRLKLENRIREYYETLGYDDESVMLIVKGATSMYRFIEGNEA